MITVQVFISLEFYLQCQYQTNVPPIFTYLLLTSVVFGVYCKCSAHSPVSLFLSLSLSPVSLSPVSLSPVSLSHLSPSYWFPAVFDQMMASGNATIVAEEVKSRRIVGLIDVLIEMKFVRRLETALKLFNLTVMEEFRSEQLTTVWAFYRPSASCLLTQVTLT